MGMTIHYTIKTRSDNEIHVRDLIEQLHRSAREATFEQIGDVVDLACDGPPASHDPNHGLIHQSSVVVQGDEFSIKTPKRLLGFSTLPGHGSEKAHFALCLRDTAGTWSFEGHCKTQYATNEAHGGIVNFVRSHLAVISVLDKAQDLDILSYVRDESGFWEHRDIELLVHSVGLWNEQIAAVVETMKGKHGSNIAAFSNSEHLDECD